MKIEYIDHVNLVVEDFLGMTAFYRDTLGLRQTRDATIAGDWIDAVTGLKGVEADVVYLETGSGMRLELICYRSPKGRRPRELGKPNTRGLRHFAFRVTDLDTVVATLRKAGVELLSDIKKVPTTQVAHGGRQKRIIYSHDPEGNLLEWCDYQ